MEKQYTEKDEKDLYLEDRTYKIYLNTACAEEAIPDGMKSLFRYIRSMKVESGDTTSVVVMIEETGGEFQTG